MATLSLALGVWRSARLIPAAASTAIPRIPCFASKPDSAFLRSRVRMSAQQASFCSTAAGKPAEAELTTAQKTPVVSADWLHQHLGQPHVKILDASWYMPAEQRNPLQEFTSCHIPGALFFDIDGIVDDSVDLPHMLPSEAAFAAAMSALGLQNADTVVVYDGKGIFSAARAWWMFRVFGHEKVYVLNGGLPQWRSSGYALDLTTSEKTLSKIQAAVDAVKKAAPQAQADGGGFRTSFQQSLVWSLDQVKRNVEEKAFQHIDARSKARFDGTAPEPRKGVKAGHVPGSLCIPFNEVLNNDGLLLPPSVLQAKFRDAGLTLEAPIITSCGTGVTACILALALHQIGIADVPVYDGSWTEWGGLSDTPIATAESVQLS